jgi:phosphoribosylanthranilate isomerase
MRYSFMENKLNISPKIKICGLKSLKDIELVNVCKPDYCGFILAPSKRKIEISNLQEYLKKLDQSIIPVGVFVNENIAKVMECVNLGIKVVQLHGDEDWNYIKDLKALALQFKIHIWKAIRVKEKFEEEFINFNNFNNVDAILFDKFDVAEYGGTGKTFNWNIINKLRMSKPLVLAGGLNCDNIKKAIEVTKPFCVDVSSGVETNGEKDKYKVEKFIETTRKMSILS